MNLRREYYSLIWRTQTVGMAAQPHPKHKTPTATKTKLQFCYETNKRWPGQEKYKLQEKNQVKIKREKKYESKEAKTKIHISSGVVPTNIHFVGAVLCCFFFFFISLVFGNVVVKRIFTENKTGERKKNSFETKGKKTIPIRTL